MITDQDNRAARIDDLPAEAALVKAALEASVHSAREAARLVGLSDARLRQIANGYASAGRGQRVVAVAPAMTLAKIADLLHVSAEDLRDVGREDAAESLALLQQGAPGGGSRKVLTSRYGDEGLASEIDGWLVQILDRLEVLEDALSRVAVGGGSGRERLAEVFQRWVRQNKWSQAEVAAMGGPSATTQTKIRTTTEDLSARTLRQVDVVMGWPAGAAASVVSELIEPPEPSRTGSTGSQSLVDELTRLIRQYDGPRQEAAPSVALAAIGSDGLSDGERASIAVRVKMTDDDRREVARRVAGRREEKFGTKSAAYTAAGINSATWDRIESGEIVRGDRLIAAVKVLWPASNGDWRAIPKRSAAVTSPVFGDVIVKQGDEEDED